MVRNIFFHPLGVNLAQNLSKLSRTITELLLVRSPCIIISVTGPWSTSMVLPGWVVAMVQVRGLS